MACAFTAPDVNGNPPRRQFSLPEHPYGQGIKQKTATANDEGTAAPAIVPLVVSTSTGVRAREAGRQVGAGAVLQDQR